MQLVSWFSFYGHYMESASTVSLCGQLVLWRILSMVIQSFLSFSSVALSKTHILVLWQSMVWNSYLFFILVFYENLVFVLGHHVELIFFSLRYSMKLMFILNFPFYFLTHVLPKLETFRVSRLHSVIQGFWFRLSPIYQNFFHILLFSFQHARKIPLGLLFLKVIPVV